ncbi:PaaX family transcriptional regulator C-terminal domain-containing protein, partial [Streptomyces himastatinicus]|uniref:PaaX family transcriptional regulator C-terminal domain-containing protein n=1 Tax=Streptomyces himastatinicus TaxID=998084 RepID=UPI0001B4B0F5
RLWDLPEGADRADRLVEALDAARSPADSFTVAAAMLRHLLTDPVLPDELLPRGWPGAELRARYDAFETDFRGLLRQYTA